MKEICSRCGIGKNLIFQGGMSFVCKDCLQVLKNNTDQFLKAIKKV